MLTIEEYAQLPEDDGYRHELVRGRLVREPQPKSRHGLICTKLAHFLYQFVEPRQLGIVLSGSGFVLTTFKHTVRGPDVSYYSRDRLPDYPEDEWPTVAPDLAIEVLSPSNRASTMQHKVLDYLDSGVRMVWLIAPRLRTVTVYRSLSEIRVLRSGEQLSGEDVLPGFQLPVDRLFT